jgi:hypothetical protein
VQANVVASLLRGYKPNLSPLFQQPTFSPPLYDQFTLQPKPTYSSEPPKSVINSQLEDQNLGRKLLQDVVAVRSLPYV